MKKVQIDYELFRKLIFYHLGSDDQYEEEIRNGLEDKLDALVRHELYTKYKTAPSEEEQEKARQEYLDKRGVSSRLSMVMSVGGIYNRSVARTCIIPNKENCCRV